MLSMLYGVHRITTSPESIRRVVHETSRSHSTVCLSLSVRLLGLPVMSSALLNVSEMYVFLLHFIEMAVINDVDIFSRKVSDVLLIVGIFCWK